jgi:hypothetical protein
MKKTFTHNGITFEITVKLNYRVERRFEGLREHLVSLHNCNTDIILLESIVTHEQLFDCIAKFTKHVENLTNGKIDEYSKTENKLIEIGFEKI